LESSSTRQFSTATPSFAAAARKMSGAGLPRLTSSPQTMPCTRGSRPTAASWFGPGAAGRGGHHAAQAQHVEHVEQGGDAALQGDAPSAMATS
jgi:hypothetical protein